MPVSRKETQRQTRDRLLEAAHASIVEEGVASISIRSICAAAGRTHGAFYSNFSSKDDLLVDLMEMHILEEVSFLRRILSEAAGNDVDETLRILTERLAYVATEPEWSLLSIELQLHARRDSDFARRHNASKATCYRVFCELIEDLVIRYNLLPALPPLQIGIGLYALWSGMAVQGDVAQAMPREQMLLAFFRAMTGLKTPNGGSDEFDELPSEPGGSVRADGVISEAH